MLEKVSARIFPCIQKACEATAKAFKKGTYRKPIAQCAKELNLNEEILRNFSWPVKTLNRTQYATLKFAQEAGIHPSSIALKTINKTFNINAALRSYSKIKG